MAGDGTAEEVTITAEECLEETEAAEEQADLVLGGDDGDKCTYSQGYLPRQAVFSCLTCTPGSQAGFCFACSLHCHDGHQVEEVYTRRNFRCDCGNSKFGGRTCKLQDRKDPTNAQNVYNQNFGGTYCRCARPYPDPEREKAGLGEEMIQCCICEDWFHEEHLGLGPKLSIPIDEEGDHLFEDFICPGCAKCCSFLALYPDLPVQPVALEEEEEGEPEVNNQLGSVEIFADTPHDTLRTVRGGDEGAAYSSAKKVSQPVESGAAEICRNFGSRGGITEQRDQAGESNLHHANTEMKPGQGTSAQKSLAGRVGEGKKPHEKDGSCMCKVASKKVEMSAFSPDRSTESPFFMPRGWRSEICSCSDCRSMYEENKVGFLCDALDTIAAYEERAKRKREGQPSSMDRAMAAFMGNSGISHVQKMEMIHGFNELSARMKDFLQPYSQTGETVTRDAIVNFFADLNEKRRRIR